MCGLSAVTSPMLFSTYRRQTSGFAVIPETHKRLNVFMARGSICIDWKRLKTMTGSITFN
jgi:hypothetical protein